jgi:tetratricopeptide (TPR) repeat protein
MLLRQDPDEAIRCLRRAADLCPEQLRGPRLRLAEVLLEQGRHADAEPLFRQVLGRDPSDCRAHLGLGRLAQLRGDWDGSVRHLTRSATSSFARKTSLILLVAAYHRLGRVREAAEAQWQASQLPDDPAWTDPLLEQLEPLGVSREMRLLRANRLLQSGRAGEAVRVLRGAVHDYPDGLARTNLGRALIETQKYGEAERVLRAAVRGREDSVDAWFYLGVALYLQADQGIQQRADSTEALRQFSEAAACFRRTIRLKPNHAFAYYNLGHCLKYQGKFEAAAWAFRQAARCKPEFADAYTNLADVLVRQGQDAEAVYWMGNALRLAPPADPAPRRLLVLLVGRSIWWR